jgi:hypothetical protein
MEKGKYTHKDFKTMVKLVELEGYEYSYNSNLGEHDFKDTAAGEIVSIKDYEGKEGGSDWDKICEAISEWFGEIIPGIHKKYEVWHLSDAANNGFAEEWLILATNDLKKATEEARYLRMQIKGKEGIELRTDICDTEVVLEGIGSYEYSNVEF